MRHPLPLVGSVGAAAASLALTLTLCGSLPGQSRPATLDAAENRLRQIYEQGAFRSRRFRGQWLPDSSSYVVTRPTRPGAAAPDKIDAETGKPTPLSPEERRRMTRSANASPSGAAVLSIRRGNLFVRDRGTGRTVQLTRNARPGEVRNGRAAWSPDGKRIAFVETDHSKVRLRSRLLPTDPSYPKVREDRFARVGEVIPSLRVGIVEATGGEVRWLDLDAPAEGFYLGQVEWAGNAEELLVERLSRFRDARTFLLVDRKTGASKRIFHEKSNAWVVASYAVNQGLVWLDGGRSFLVITERDGWRHAYRFDRDGTERGLLTPGNFDIIERAAVDAARGLFYFYASPDDASQKYLYRVRLDGRGGMERVTPTDQPGTHAYELSPDGSFAFHTYSRFDVPPVTDLVALPEHRRIRILEANDALRARVEKAALRPTEFLELDIGEGIRLDAWLMKPPGFDPARRYPVLVYVYSEPHAQTVLDDWGQAQADYHRLVSDLGYLVVSIDSRGTPAPKGAAWRRAVFGSLGPLSTKEQAAALRALARKHPFVDLERVGIWGWSGGGSNTLNAMFRAPDLYKVGIAVAAKPQPHLYNAWFQEIYMRTREVNPEGYRRSAPIHFAEGLRGDLLIVHGTGELNTHIQIIEGLVDRLIELGKRFDYFTYPNRRHGIREGKGTTIHLRMLMIRYLLDHLAPGPR